MTEAYFSSTLNHPADQVWGLIRDFNNYPRYIDGVTESVIEDDRGGDEVGAVRRFCYAGNWIRQRLTAHSERDRALTYAGLDPFPFPEAAGAGAAAAPAPITYEGTIRLKPIVDGNQTFIEWFVRFDGQAQDAAQWHRLLVVLIDDWVSSLRRTLAHAA
jgi:hypothetical protein